MEFGCGVFGVLGVGEEMVGVGGCGVGWVEVGVVGVGGGVWGGVWGGGWRVRGVGGGWVGC